MSSPTHKQQVLAIIRKYPQAANDDPYLLDRYYHEVEDWDDTKSFYWNMSRVTPAESITRIRRKLYNEGLITYSDKVLESRTARFVEERNEYSLDNHFSFNDSLFPSNDELLGRKEREY